MKTPGMNFKRFYLYFIGLPIAFVLSIWLYFAYYPIVAQPSGVVYYLKSGLSKEATIQDMGEQGVVRLPLLFSFYAYIHAGAQLKSGEYMFPKGSTHVSIWKQITTGTGFYYRHFTIVPGWTFIQVRRALASSDELRPVAKNWSDSQVMNALGFSGIDPEGMFFPETYFYSRGNPDLVLLKRSADLMKNQLEDLWQRRAPGLPYKDKYQALIAASLIEKEAYLPSERPIIAGVLINRLRKGMLLQFDPTVIYGLGLRYDGKIHKKDLMENTPYNTYVHKGLPPTPIGMPSLSSLEAALHPATHDYYYFVAKGDGSHQFSKSLAEHQTAVNQFRIKKT